MDYGKEFKNYAINHQGISSTYYDKIMSSMYPVNMTPNIIEERQLNAIAMDVFSRLMMDRIIFLVRASTTKWPILSKHNFCSLKVRMPPRIYKSTSIVLAEVSTPGWASMTPCNS